MKPASTRARDKYIVAAFQAILVGLAALLQGSHYLPGSPQYRIKNYLLRQKAVVPSAAEA